MRHRYPAIYCSFLKHAGRDEEFRALDDGTELTYTWYIFGTLIPKLSKLRREGCLTHAGIPFFSGVNIDADYLGEIDKDGLACGYGMLRTWDGNTSEGTFIENK